MNGLSAPVRRGLLIAAAVLIAVAAVWLLLLGNKEKNDRAYLEEVCERINEFGYDLRPSDLDLGYRSFESRPVSISEVMADRPDIDRIVELSRECGFRSDIDAVGGVEFYETLLDEETGMAVWLLNGKPELVYLIDRQSLSADSIKNK